MTPSEIEVGEILEAQLIEAQPGEILEADRDDRQLIEAKGMTGRGRSSRLGRSRSKPS